MQNLCYIVKLSILKANETAVLLLLLLIIRLLVKACCYEESEFSFLSFNFFIILLHITS